MELEKVYQEMDEQRLRELKKERRISEAAGRIGMSLGMFKKRIEIRKERDFFLDRYGDLLPTSGHIHLQGQLLQADSVYDFDEAVLFALKHSYSFFDNHGNMIEDKKYDRILDRIGKFNPEWVERFRIHHQFELERIERVRKGKLFRPSQ